MTDELVRVIYDALEGDISGSQATDAARAVRAARWESFTTDELLAMTHWALAKNVLEIVNDETEFGRFASKLYAELQRVVDRRTIHV